MRDHFTRRFLSADGGVAVFALPTDPHRQQCEPLRQEVESVLGGHFGVPVPMRLVADAGDVPAGSNARPAASEPADDYAMDAAELDALENAPAAVTSPEDRLKQAFPGAEEVP